MLGSADCAALGSHLSICEVQVTTCAMWADIMAGMVKQAPDFAFNVTLAFAKDNYVAGGLERGHNGASLVQPAFITAFLTCSSHTIGSQALPYTY